MFCKKSHRHWTVLDQVAESQAGTGRHKCTGCAYEKGYDDFINHQGFHLDAEILPDSQAGYARHKDVDDAYRLGYHRAQQGLPRH